MVNNLYDRRQSTLISSLSDVDDSANLDLLPSCGLDVDCRHCGVCLGLEISQPAFHGMREFLTYERSARDSCRDVLCKSSQVLCDFLKIDVRAGKILARQDRDFLKTKLQNEIQTTHSVLCRLNSTGWIQLQELCRPGRSSR